MNDNETYNIRFSWEFQPLSYIYIVYNHGSMYNNLLMQSSVEDQLIGKISFLK